MEKMVQQLVLWKIFISCANFMPAICLLQIQQFWTPNSLWYTKFEKSFPILPCKSAIDAISKCDKMIYPTIDKLLKIFVTLSVTTCVSERSFSTLHILKTYLTSTMTQSWLNGLALLYIHREIDVTITEGIQELCKTKRNLDFIL